MIDEEVERILREEEDRTRQVLREHRAGLEAVARSLLERETIDGAEVGRLVDTAMGHHAGGPRVFVHADGTEELAPPGPEEAAEPAVADPALSPAGGAEAATDEPEPVRD